MLIDGM